MKQSTVPAVYSKCTNFVIVSGLNANFNDVKEKAKNLDANRVRNFIKDQQKRDLPVIERVKNVLNQKKEKDNQAPSFAEEEPAQNERAHPASSRARKASKQK